MLQETGDKEGLQKAAGQLRADKDRYRDFCKEKGLAAHNENTQVYGYDRKASMKTVWAEKALTKGGESDTINDKINQAYNSSTLSLTDHVLDQAIERGVTVDEMLDAVDNSLMDKPVKIDELGRPSFQRIGSKATVSINPDNYNVTSTWPTGEKTLKKIHERRRQQ